MERCTSEPNTNGNKAELCFDFPLRGFRGPLNSLPWAAMPHLRDGLDSAFTSKTRQDTCGPFGTVTRELSETKDDI
jgi:hypothetical protein